MNLGEQIKKYRKAKGMTQKELAEKIGKGYSTVQKYELNLTQPPVEVIKEIAIVLEVPMIDLLYSTEHDSEEDFWDAISKEVEANHILLKKELINAYNSLNTTGKCKVNEYIIDLSELEKYTKPDNED